MARRLGTVGYYVLLPNLYYRAGRDTIYGPDVLDRNSPDHARMRAVRTKMTIPPVMRDVAAMLAFIDTQDAAKKGPVGAHGYCMSGPYALAAAARYPDRIAAAASFYGTWLINDAEESPHLNLGRIRGEALYRLRRARRPRAAADGRGTAWPVSARRHRGRDRIVSRRASRFRVPTAVVLRQAGRRAPLGTADRAVSQKAGLRGSPRAADMGVAGFCKSSRSSRRRPGSTVPPFVRPKHGSRLSPG